MIATRLAFWKGLVDANGIFQIDQSEHIVEVRAWNLGQFGLTPVAIEQPVIGELGAFPRIRARTDDTLA